ncbi:MAG: FtsX-like permease family protein [Lachnospiraceae bacterium]
MLRRIKRDILPQFLLFITTVVFMLICMNIVGIMNRFSKAKMETDAGETYIYHSYYKVNFNVTEDIKEDSRNAVEKELGSLFEATEKSESNVFVCQIPGQVNGGGKEQFQVYLAFNEPVPYPLQSGDYDFDKTGVYVGNAYSDYIKEDNIIKVFLDELPVLGIMETKGIEENEMFLLSYDTLSGQSQKEILDVILYQKYDSGAEDESLVICLGSNNHEVKKDELFLEQTADSLSLLSIEKITETEDNNDVEISGIESIKIVIYISAFFFCVLNLIRVLELYTKRKRRDIAICRAFGRSRSGIFVEMFKEVAIVLLCGAFCAWVFEIIVYVWWKGYYFPTVFLYGLGALAILFVVCALVLAISLMRRFYTGIADDVKLEY